MILVAKGYEEYRNTFTSQGENIRLTFSKITLKTSCFTVSLGVLEKVLECFQTLKYLLNSSFLQYHGGLHILSSCNNTSPR